MLNGHTSLGVADIVFYGPILLLAFTLAFIRHSRPRMAWWFLLMFSCFRIASGIVSILYERDQSSIGLLIAAIVTLNVGVIPLLLCTIGFIRIIAVLDHADSQRLRKAILLTRAAFFVGIALLVAGGVLVGRYDQPALAHMGSSLTKAGYVVIACNLGLMIAFEAFFWNRHRSQPLSRSSVICLSAITAAMPFQIVRIAYALLALFVAGNSRWDVLKGELGAFIGMVLVMEYVVVIMYTVTGFVIDPIGKKVPGSVEDASNSLRVKRFGSGKL